MQFLEKHKMILFVRRLIGQQNKRAVKTNVNYIAVEVSDNLITLVAEIVMLLGFPISFQVLTFISHFILLSICYYVCVIDVQITPKINNNGVILRSKC